MSEANPVSVEHLPTDFVLFVPRRIPIGGIAEDRIFVVLEVDANLVGAAGLRKEAD